MKIISFGANIFKPLPKGYADNKSFGHQENKGKESYEHSLPSALGGLFGALLPVLILSKIKNGKFGFDVFEYEGKFGRLKELGSILLVNASAIAGGLLGGLSGTKNDEDKKEKMKEATFGFLTNLVPTPITTGILAIASKMNKENTFTKIIAAVIGIGFGMPLAQKLAHQIDKKFINKDSTEIKERKLKPSDYLVHIDDICSLVIITGLGPKSLNSVAQKFLPLIYARLGFEAGSARALKKDTLFNDFKKGLKDIPQKYIN